MKYNFETVKKNYEYLSSGSVIKSMPGMPAFPVRLVSEIFQRGLTYISPLKKQLIVYDPCCGTGYLLTVLGIIHGQKIQHIIGTDIDERAITVASNNLHILNRSGIKKRISEIENQYLLFKKESYEKSLQGANKINNIIINHHHHNKSEIVTETHRLNVLYDFSKLENIVKEKIDVVITDLPYGNTTSWIAKREDEIHTEEFILLQNLKNIISHRGIVILSTQKKMKIQHPDFDRVKTIKSGKRKFHFFRLIKN